MRFLGGYAHSALVAYRARLQKRVVGAAVRVSSVHPMSQPDPPGRHLVLTPPEWREALRAELIAGGFEQDAAGVVARRVIEALVRSYLGGGIEASVTRPLDEAA